MPDSDATPILALPLILPSQADKHVTHNEAILALDALLHLSVEATGANTPPVAPAEGARHRVGPAPSGPWAGQAGKLAQWRDGGWIFFAPAAGWTASVAADSHLLVHDGTDWRDLKARAADIMGINATADTTNRLSVSSPASLFNHSGTGHQLKINKATAGDTASIVFQTGFSGRIEMGATGDDRFHLKVSANGAGWTESLVADAATGFVGVGGVAAPTAALHVGGAARVGQYAKAALPSAASSGAGAIIHVTDEAGGAVLAFSDGTAWRRVTDRAVVS